MGYLAPQYLLEHMAVVNTWGSRLRGGWFRGVAWTYGVGTTVPRGAGVLVRRAAGSRERAAVGAAGAGLSCRPPRMRPPNPLCYPGSRFLAISGDFFTLLAANVLAFLRNNFDVTHSAPETKFWTLY